MLETFVSVRLPRFVAVFFTADWKKRKIDNAFECFPIKSNPTGVRREESHAGGNCRIGVPARYSVTKLINRNQNCERPIFVLLLHDVTRRK